MSEQKNTKENKINTDFLDRCIQALETSYNELQKLSPENIEYDIYRSACVKEFEIILEQCGKLLKKCLRDFFHSNKAVDDLRFKNIFRYSAKHGLINIQSSERWCKYRDNRNDTAHDYGVGFAEETLNLLSVFITDAKEISDILKKKGI